MVLERGFSLLFGLGGGGGGLFFFFRVAICLEMGFVSVGWPVVFDNLMTCWTSMTFCLSDSALANRFILSVYCCCLA